MTKKKRIFVFQTIEKLSEHLYEIFRVKTNNIPEGNYLSVAISGGSTPKSIFNYISSRNINEVNWRKVRLFWVDERCVPPDHDDSNFKMAQDNFLKTIGVPDENIFRIQGESDPEKEAIRYSQIIKSNVGSENGLSKFDLVLLGLGEDGHTASIFPDNISLFNSTNLCEAATHPQSGQQRITITGPVINNADSVVFMVTGAGKAKILSQIMRDNNESDYPASLVNPTNGDLIWLLDTDAARYLDKHSNYIS